MSVVTARCDYCNTELSCGHNEFLYVITIDQKSFCYVCNNQRSSKHSRTWRFCSAACFIDGVKVCNRCGGNSWCGTFDDEGPVDQVICSDCQGRGLQLVYSEKPNT